MRTSVAVSTAFAVVLLVGASASTATAAVAAKKHKLPKNVCALLSNSQVATLVPNATGSSSPQPSPNERECSWRDESPDATSLNSLNVTVTKLPIPTAEAKAALKAEAKREAGAYVIKGLGTFAYQHSAIPPNTEVKLLYGKFLLDVEFSGSGPVTGDEKTKTIEITRTMFAKI